MHSSASARRLRGCLPAARTPPPRSEQRPGLPLTVLHGVQAGITMTVPVPQSDSDAESAAVVSSTSSRPVSPLRTRDEGFRVACAQVEWKCYERAEIFDV